MWHLGKYGMTDQPRLSREDQSFFGSVPERLQAMADEAERQFEQASTAYGDALIALGNAHTTHASPAVEALRAFEKALFVYSLHAGNVERVADVHHRLASVLRRLGEHGEAAENLAKAVALWEEKGTAEGPFLEQRRKELRELRAMHRNTLERRLPPG